MKKSLPLLKWLPAILFAALLAFIVCSTRCDIPVETLKARYAKPNSRFVDIRGMSVHCVDEGTGFPVVLIHGTAASLHTWDAWVSVLTPYFRVVRMDLPAYGLTGPNREHDYSIKAYVEFIRELLNRLGIDACHMAGNSLGGSITWNFALAYPGRVGSIILIDAGGYPRTAGTPLPFRIARTPGLNLIARYVTPRFIIRASLLDVYGDGGLVTDELVDRYYDMALREGNREAFIARSALSVEPDPAPIKNIHARTLIMWGAKDRWIPVEDAYKFRNDIGNSRLKVYDGAGHAPMEEIPVQTAEDAKRFLMGLN